MNTSSENRLRGPNGESYAMNGSRGYCYVCQVELTSPQHCQQHIDGGKHLKKEKETAGTIGLPSPSPPSVTNAVQGQISPHTELKTVNTGPSGEQYNKLGAGGRCHICDVDFTSRQLAIQHLEGARHKKNAAANQSSSRPFLMSNGTGLARPDVGGTNFAQFQPTPEHPATSAQHVSLPERPILLPDQVGQVGAVNFMSSPVSTRGPNGEPYIMRGDRGYCFVCQLELTSVSHAQQHINGQKHVKKCEAGGLDSQRDCTTSGPPPGKVLMCSVCKVPFSCMKNAEDHFLSQKHKKKEEELHQTPSISLGGSHCIVPRRVTPDQIRIPNASFHGASVIPSSSRSSESPKNISSESELPFQEMTTALVVSNVSQEIKHPRTREVPTTEVTIVNLNSNPQLGNNDTSLPIQTGHVDSAGLCFAPGASSINNAEEASVISNVEKTPASYNTVEASSVNNAEGLPFMNNVSKSVKIKHQNEPRPETSHKYKDYQGSNFSETIQEVLKVKNKELGDHALLEGSKQTSKMCAEPASIDDNTQQTGSQKAVWLQALSNQSEETLPKIIDAWIVSEPPVHSDHQATRISPPELTLRSETEHCQQIKNDLHFEQNQNHLQENTPQQDFTHTPGFQPPADLVSGQNKAPGNVVPYFFDGSRGYCTCCRVELTSLQHANQHLNGQKHQKKYTQWELMQALQSHSPSVARPSATLTVHNVTVNKTNNFSVPESPSGGDMPYYFSGSRGFCHVCNIELTSYQHAEQHINGRSHKRNHERLSFSQSGHVYPLYCDICKKSFTGQESARQHFVSIKHQAKVELVNESVQTLGLLDEGRKINKDGAIWYFCDICQVPLNTQEQFDIHKQSPKHKKEAENNHAKNMAQRANEENAGHLGKMTVDLAKSGKEFTAGAGIQRAHYTRENIESTDQSALDKVHQNQDFELAVQESDLRQRVLEENRHHLTYGEAPVTSPAQISTSWSTGMVQNSASANSVLRLSSVGQAARVDGKRPILGAGSAISRQELDSPTGYGRSQLPTERYNGLAFALSSAQTASQMSDNMQGYNPLHQLGTGADGPFFHQSKTGVFGAVGDQQIVSASQRSTGGGSVGTGFAEGRLSQGQGHDSNSEGCSQSREEGGRAVDKFCRGDGSMEEAFGAGGSRSVGGLDKNIPGLPGLGQVIAKPPSHHTPTRGQSKLRRDNLSMDKKDDDLSEAYHDEEEDTNFNIQGEEDDLQEVMAQLAVKPQTNLPMRSFKSGFRYCCQICKQHMNTKDSFDSHIKGKRHLYMMSKIPCPDRQLDPIRKTKTEEVPREVTQTSKDTPRDYQLELIEKAMTGDKIIYLPTGTGKTLVAVLTMALMLKINPTRPVLFLVDKVLLVLQQASYIMTQLGDQYFLRRSLQSETEIGKRKLQVKPICGGLTTKTNLAVWEHDIVVTTAAFCSNMLQEGQIRWSDFSLVVLDEVHHCNKGHPYQRLMTSFHYQLSQEERPKILGLTASPAGKDTEEQTYFMLKHLLGNLGGAGIALVEHPEFLENLKQYQSNAEIISVCVEMSNKEKTFKHHLLVYFIKCYTKLAAMCPDLEKNDDTSILVEAVNKPHDMEMMHRLAEQFLKDEEPLEHILRAILQAECRPGYDIEQQSRFDHLRMHIQMIYFTISEIGSGPCCIQELLKEFGNILVIKEIEKMGLPCAEMHQRVQNFAVDGNKDLTLFSKLEETLIEPGYIDWSDKTNKALVLVRERRLAKQYAKLLRQSCKPNNTELSVHHLVGHGKGAHDGGMDVKKQKKILDNQDKIDVFVATSIMEEGVDFSALQLVVCMNPPTSLRALVQMRGRARKRGSYFVVLCYSNEEASKLEKLQRQEKNMEAAAQRCLREEREGQNAVSS